MECFNFGRERIDSKKGFSFSAHIWRNRSRTGFLSVFRIVKSQLLNNFVVIGVCNSFRG